MSYQRQILKNETGYYAGVFYSCLVSIGVKVRVEDSTNKGRIDMMVLMACKVIIFEFKVVDLIKDPMPALVQTKNKAYADKYKSKNYLYIWWG